MQKPGAKLNGAQRIRPAVDDRDAETSPIPDIKARRGSINSIGSAHSDSSKDEGKSPGHSPSPPYSQKRKMSIQSIGSIGSEISGTGQDSDTSAARSSHFSAKLRIPRHQVVKDPNTPQIQQRHIGLDANFKVPAILLLSNKLFKDIYITSKKMFVMAVISVMMCIIENEIWFGVYIADTSISTASELVLSKNDQSKSSICKIIISAVTMMLCFYITVYYKQLLLLKDLRRSEIDIHQQHNSGFFRSILFWQYLLEMFVCLIHVPYGLEFNFIIEFRAIKAFYRGEMVVTLMIFLRLYHIVRVIRDYTLIRFKNAMFLSKLVHVDQDVGYAVKVILHENPVTFVLCGLFSALLLFGYLLRIYDTTARPLTEQFGIAQSYWIGLLSLTTVGYGDDVPKSHLGRIMVVLLVYIGSILIPLQIAIVERLLQFNLQEDRMIRVYRMEQKRHAFQRAAVQLVVRWYRSVKAKKQNELGDHILVWKKFRISHANSRAGVSTIHNEPEKNLSAVTAPLTACVNGFTNAVRQQTENAQELTQRCNANMQTMQLLAERLEKLLGVGATGAQIAAKISTAAPQVTQSEEKTHQAQQHLHSMPDSSVSHQEPHPQRGTKTIQFRDNQPTAPRRDSVASKSVDDGAQGHAVGLNNHALRVQPAGANQQLAHSSGFNDAHSENYASESSASIQGVQYSGSVVTPASSHVVSQNQMPPAQVPMGSRSPHLHYQRDLPQSSPMPHQHSAAENFQTQPFAGDTGYSNAQALSHIPGEVYGQGYVQDQRHAPPQQHSHQFPQQQNTYHNQSADAAFSRPAASGFADSQIPIEGFYPPPHSYSPEAIQFHRDRIYEQARPSLNSILRSSPGLIPSPDAQRLRPATYFSSKSPPIPLLTRPNSPGPKGFTPVRVKPFNPQGVMSPLQGSAPVGSSSAYAKFLLARSEYKPESTHNSP